MFLKKADFILKKIKASKILITNRTKIKSENLKAAEQRSSAVSNASEISFDFDKELRKKYPALQDALEHYQSVRKMCETREKEESDD